LFESPEDIIFWIKLFLYNLIEFEWVHVNCLAIVFN
jgi:hypothetical protein